MKISTAISEPFQKIYIKFYSSYDFPRKKKKNFISMKNSDNFAGYNYSIPFPDMWQENSNETLTAVLEPIQNMHVIF